MHESLSLFKQAMILVVLLSAPTLITAVVVGITISLIQALMQLQDQTLPFALKLFSVALALALTGRWMGLEIMRLADLAFKLIPTLGFSS